MRDFEQDRHICEAASKGPWDAYYGCCNNRVNGGPHYNIIAAGKELRTEDATFIAAAREGWPAALAEIENLKLQLQVAANTEACEGRCPETEECPTDRDCVDCWLEYLRQQAGEGENA